MTDCRYRSVDAPEEGHLPDRRLELTAQIVSAYLRRWPQPPEALPRIISSVWGALGEGGVHAARPRRPSPAQIRASIRPDGLVSFENGRVYQLLKPHLKSFGLTPQAYREKWGLRGDYPMVCANHTARRAELARAVGLGRDSPGRRPRRDRPPSSRP